MKKLIVLSVVFALVAATAAFAVDVGGTVFGLVTPLQGDTAKDANDEASKVTGSAGFERVRFEVTVKQAMARSAAGYGYILMALLVNMRFGNPLTS